MELIAQADVVLALGTRLNPFSTLPAYGKSYWPTDVKLIQVDINADRIGLTKPVAVGIQGDARLVADGILERLAPSAGDEGRVGREATVKTTKASWAMELESMDHEQDDPGTTWNARSRARDPDRMSPRQAWRAIKRVLPTDAIISSDIGNNCAIGNAYPSFEQGRKYLAPGMFGPCGYGLPSILGAKIGRPDVPVVGFAGDGAFGISMNELTACGRNDWEPVTMVVFRNYQWGAEKRNTTLWYDDNFVGTELNVGVEYAAVANACGLKGVKVSTAEELEKALADAIEGQMKRKETTLLEVVLNQELGEPFRRDAMTKPVRYVALGAEE
jgi:sulfoacetaldehyde acetyltransferase